MQSAANNPPGLPKPANGRCGWPWTEAPNPLGAKMRQGRPWPRISVVTPSLNQGQFLEETIRSVLLQGYPNLEYVVIDGGSTDESVDIIKRYEPWLTAWVSEPDRGQSHAINKGIALTSGSILAWLNSDDLYHPETLAKVAEHFAARPDSDWIVGALDNIDERGRHLWTAHARRHASLSGYRLFDNDETYRFVVHQAATFWTRRFWKCCGPLREDLHYTMDRALWLEGYARGFVPDHVEDILATYRNHAETKSSRYLPRFHLDAVRTHFAAARRPGYRTVPNLRLAGRCVLRYLRAISLGRWERYPYIESAPIHKPNTVDADADPVAS